MSDVITKGTEAERLLNNELLNECFEEIRRKQFKAFENSNSPDEREIAHQVLTTVNLLKRELRIVLNAKQQQQNKEVLS